jgi:hypothetical protein
MFIPLIKEFCLPYLIRLLKGEECDKMSKEEKGLSLVTIQFQIGKYAIDFLKAYIEFI